MRKPKWLRTKIQCKGLNKMKNFVGDMSLNTVCQSAMCPNIGECFSKKTATFMIMGDICTRRCRFCAVKEGKPQALDEEEPKRVAEACKKLGLRHAVITSVTRDDLEDGGASHFAKTIREIKKIPSSSITVEVLVPDFKGNKKSIKTVVDARPEVINHNLETVPRLYDKVRPIARYDRSLGLLKRVKEIDPNILTKSGIMVGLGETEKEVVDLMKDLLEIGCDMLTIGQYLRPSKKHIEIEKYVTPEQFERYKDIGESLGFKHIASAPLVRSSYNAAEGLAQAEEIYS